MVLQTHPLLLPQPLRLVLPTPNGMLLSAFNFYDNCSSTSSFIR
jgi:hypothetical protein